MADHSELKKLAEDAVIFAGINGEISHAQEQFIAAANPAAVLALIAEIDGLDDEISACKTSPGGCGYWREAARTREQERDQLKAEIAGLKTGYEAYEQVNAGLKAEVEGLRKELAARHPFRFAADAPVLGYTGCVICGEFTDHQGLPCPKRVVFAMGKGEQS